MFSKHGNLAYTTDNSRLWIAQVFPDYMAPTLFKKRFIVYSLEDAKDEEEIARRIAQALVAELADDFRRGVFMKGQAPLEQSLRQ